MGVAKSCNTDLMIPLGRYGSPCREHYERAKEVKRPAVNLLPLLFIELPHYVRVMETAPPTLPAAAWMSESDIVLAAVLELVGVERDDVVGSQGTQRPERESAAPRMTHR